MDVLHQQSWKPSVIVSTARASQQPYVPHAAKTSSPPAACSPASMLPATALPAPQLPASQPPTKRLNKMKRFLTFLLTVALLLPSLLMNARGIDPVADSLSALKLKNYLDSVSTAKGRPSVVLVLSGGGAKGAAHIGVIRRIEELNIPVDMVVGTSMGGLISGMFAMGYNSYDIEKVVKDADWARLMTDKMPLKYRSLNEKHFKATHQISLPFYYDKKQFVMMKEDAYSDTDNGYKPLSFEARKEEEDQLLQDNLWESLPSGFVKGRNVKNLISSLTVGYQQEMDFMDLPIPFFCVSTDLISFKGKYWFEGSLPTALRSTMSIPFVFAPVKTEGMVLVDGGMRDNYPTAFVRSLGADIIIGMELSDPRKTYQEVNNLGDIANQMIDLLIADNYERNKDQADLKIKPDLHEYNMLSFSDENIDDIINRGYNTAIAADSALSAIKARMNGDTLSFRHPKAANLQANKYKFEEIVISGVSTAEAKILFKKVGFNNGDSLGDEEISRAIDLIYATHAFDNVSYEVYGDEEPYVLDIKCTKGPINQLGLGFNLDTEEALSMLVDVGFGTRKLMGAKFDITARVSANPNAHARFYVESPYFPTFNIAAFAQYNNFGRILAYDDVVANPNRDVPPTNRFQKVQKDNYSSWYTNAEMYFSGISWKMFDFKLGGRVDYYDVRNRYFSDDVRVFRGNYDFTDKEGAYVNAFIDMRGETFDEVYFPEHGFSLSAYYSWCGWDISNKAFSPFHVAAIDGKFIVPAKKVFAFIPSFYARAIINNKVNAPFMYANYVGGSIQGRYFAQQMPFMGINNCAAFGNYIAMVRTDFRFNVKGSHYLTFIANYLKDGGDLKEFIKYDTKNYGFYGVGAEYSYNTIIGPLTANVHYSNITKCPGGYVSIGVVF